MSEVGEGTSAPREARRKTTAKKQSFPGDLRELSKKTAAQAAGRVTLLLALATAIGAKPWEARDVVNALPHPPQATGEASLEKHVAKIINEQAAEFPAFDLIYKDLPPVEKFTALAEVTRMREVIRGNPSYNEILNVTQKWENVIRQNARRVDFPEDLALGIVFIENGGGEDITNRWSGARGVAQLMPQTARYYGLRVDNKADQRADPRQSIRAMMDYLNDLTEQFDNPGLTTWAYHAGEGNVYRALREYFIDIYGIDPGDIITDDASEARRIQNKYKEMIRETNPNIREILSNPQVQSRVLFNLTDETELYTAKAVAAGGLYKEGTQRKLPTNLNPTDSLQAPRPLNPNQGPF